MWLRVELYVQPKKKCSKPRKKLHSSCSFRSQMSFLEQPLRCLRISLRRTTPCVHAAPHSSWISCWEGRTRHLFLVFRIASSWLATDTRNWAFSHWVILHNYVLLHLLYSAHVSRTQKSAEGSVVWVIRLENVCQGNTFGPRVTHKIARKSTQNT